jgi:hypothetical protein
MTDSKPIFTILRAGPLAGRRLKGPAISIPFSIEIETSTGPAILQIGSQAALVLVEEIAAYLSLHHAHNSRGALRRRA